MKQRRGGGTLTDRRRMSSFPDCLPTKKGKRSATHWLGLELVAAVVAAVAQVQTSANIYCVSPSLPKHPPKSSLCPRDVTGWLCALQTNSSRSVAAGRKMDVGLDGGETEGWSGKWGGWGRVCTGPACARRRERERERKERGEGRQEPESESCHKTTIIRSLSATQ